MRVLAIAIVAMACSFAFGAAAHAQACDAREVAIGRVSLGDACCWPEQSLEGGRCVGAPRCPEGLVEHGDACVARAALEAAPAIVSSEASAWAAVSEPSEETVEVDWPSRVHHPDRPMARVQVGRGEDAGLVIASLVVFDLGWTLGWLGALFGELGGCFSGACNTFAWAFIPVGGAMASGLDSLSRSGNGLGYSLGITSVCLQGIGLIMLAISLANEVTVPRTQPLTLGPPGAPSIALGARDADVGLSLGVAF